LINVLIVDDSAFFRSILCQMLAKDSGIAVVGMARDGDEALALVRSLKPDVVTLDMEMPKRDGLSTLKVIMEEMPLPVIMVSQLVQAGAEATLKALEYGAMDYLQKYTGIGFGDVDALGEELCAKIRTVAQRAKRFPLRPRPKLTKPAAAPTLLALPRGRKTRDYVAIGVSTGGPPAVQKLLASLPANFPACIFIAQHMPAAFTGPFAKRLDSVCQITVKEAEDGDSIVAGTAYVAPGGKHIRVDMRGALPVLSVVTEPKEALYKPCVNVLMESLAKAAPLRTVAIIMTGMGNDGLEGIKPLKAKGGYIIAQDEASCVVYGMPKAVVDAQLANEVLPLDALANALIGALYK